MEAIQDRCHELEMCFSTDVEMQIRTTQIVARLSGRFVETFLKETGKWGVVIVFSFLALLLFFIYKFSKTSERHELVMARKEE